MTNKEAKARIKDFVDTYELEYRETAMMIKPKDYEAFKQAIKALETQEQAIKEAYEKGYEYGVKEWFEKHTKAQTCIEDYPTCTECEHYDKEKHYCPRFCQVIKDTLAEAQPCDDCVSREAVDKLSRDLVHVTRDKADFLCNFWEGLNALPAVQPKTEIENLKSEIEKPKSEMTADGDLISRQAVLDVIDAEAWAFCDYLIRENRNDEQAQIVHFSDNLRDRVKDDLPSVTPQTRWIPVSERLPETRDEVLVFLANGQMTIASYNDHILPFFDKSIGWGVDVKRFVFYFCSDDVIAWMPLPKPYKEVGEDEDSD